MQTMLCWSVTAWKVMPKYKQHTLNWCLEGNTYVTNMSQGIFEIVDTLNFNQCGVSQYMYFFRSYSEEGQERCKVRREGRRN